MNQGQPTTRERKKPVEFAIIGGGWRARTYLRIARSLPAKFRVSGIVVRNPEKQPVIEQEWGVRVFSNLQAMLDSITADFVVTAVSWHSNPPLLHDLAQRNMPVLSETPPAPDLDGLLALHRLAEQGAKIQVAEQYWLVPHHAARLAVVATGVIGQPTQAQISVAHGYHGISLIRRFLNLGFESPRITATRFTSPVVGWPGLEGELEKERIEQSPQDIAWLDFGNKLGVLDFTAAQYFSAIRNERLLIRGERGEIINDQVHFLKDFRTPVSMTLRPRLEGIQDKVGPYVLRDIECGERVVYENPFPQTSLTVHEIAVAACLVKMHEYVMRGISFYSLAEASQDHYLSLLCQQAIEQGRTIKAERQPWAV